MRILIVVWDSPADGTSGAAGHVRGLAAAMTRLGHDVVVFAADRSNASGDQLDFDGVRVYGASIDLPWLPEDEPIAFIASANHHISSLVAELGDWRPEVVHAHDWTSSWSANSLARIFDVPLVATFHSTQGSSHGGAPPIGRPSTIHAVESWLAHASDEVICCSRFMVREVSESFELLDNVHLVPHGIDAGRWNTGGAQPRGSTVLAWGRVQYEKGFQILAQAMAIVRASLPGVDCVIAGRGPYLPELQSQIDVEGVSDLVQLVGFLPDSQLRALLRTAGCVVIPSLYEPFGIVALEALAAGAPTVVARTGGLAEIVEGTAAGLLFEPGNAQQLADCILRVFGDESLAMSMTSQGLNLVRHRYSWTAVAEKTVEVYRSATTRKGVSVR